MVSMQTADNALKSFYLDAVSEALDMRANPLLAQIKKTSDSVVGKDVRKLVRYGVNGGIGAGSETGDLPKAGGNNYVQFTSSLKNLYGTIEISDKAVRASATNEGAFVNLLNDEMQALIKSSSFNFGRMLYGDGTGKLATVASVEGSVATVDDVKGIVEGMLVDFHTASGVVIAAASAKKIIAVDRNAKAITFQSALNTAVTGGATVHLQNSYGKEISGLAAIFSESETLYGVNREVHGWLKPYVQDEVGGITENIVQKAIDTIEENSGGKVNFIVCSWGVKRALTEYYTQNRMFVQMVELDGGFKAISFCGIPVVADRFCPEGTMYLLNTDDFRLHQLCDWQWLEGEDGKILKQIPGKPVYTATLVKYAELMCERPYGQGVLRGIEEQ